MADDGQASGAELVHGVLGGVPVGAGGIESDEVGGGNSALEKRIVVIGHGFVGVVDEGSRVAQARGGGPDQVGERLGGIRFPSNAHVVAAYDIGEQERADFLEVAADG